MDDDGSERSSLAVARLPDDAIVEILSRLHAKSLCRCKCVSKPWRDLIADRLRYTDLTQALQGFLYFDVGIGTSGGHGSNSSDDGTADGGDLANGRDDDDDDKMLLRHGYGRFINLVVESVPLLDPSFAFLKKKQQQQQQQPGVESVALLDSCNGLLLFGHRRVSDTYNSLGDIVCNPATEQWVAVPSSGWTPTPPEEIVDECENYVSTFLIFDPSVSSHFDLVQFWQDGMTDDVEAVHTYSSAGTGLWSDRSCELRRWGDDLHVGNSDAGRWWIWSQNAVIQTPPSGRALVNGMLHFLVFQLEIDKFVVVAVDGQGKTCRVIFWPDDQRFSQDVFIGQSQGRLHCISGLVEGGNSWHVVGLTIWVLEDEGAEKWVLKHSVKKLDLVGFHADRNLIFFVHRWDEKLISYDMDSREVCVLCTLGHGYPYVTPYDPSFRSFL